METFWFVAIAFMLTAYVILDGYDLGAGIVHLFVARTQAERRRVLGSIGPFWDGNEVWLVAAGSALVMAFPVLYATAFSGFYLPLMMVLWLLIGRALSIELSHQLHHPLWEAFWDRIFAVTSALLVFGFGAAFGNVVRGVPIREDGTFFLPLWGSGERLGVLDPFTILVGATALAAVALHGALWCAMRLDGDVRRRATRLAPIAVGVVAVLSVATTISALQIQPHIGQRLSTQPWIYALGVVAVAGMVGAFHFNRRGSHTRAFLSSCTYLLGMLASAVFSLYPLVLPASDPARSLTAAAAKSGDYALSVAMAWWIPGILLAIGYQVVTYRVFRRN